MKITVDEKVEKKEMMRVMNVPEFELRGNFSEIVDSEGNVQYECDAYRTSNTKDTFEQLHRKFRIDEAKKFLKSTYYIHEKISRALALRGSADSVLDEFSDTFRMTNREVLVKADEAKALIDELSLIS